MTAPTPREGILDIKPYVPGKSGDDDDTRPVIKLSSNESALGPSRHAIEAAKAAAETMVRYPDGSSTELREAIGKRWDLDPDRIICGCGSDELLESLPQVYTTVGDEVLYSQYGFAVYPIATRAAGATPVTAPEGDYRTDVDAMLAAVTERTKLVFLANPNNPTGSYTPADEVRRLRDGLPGHVLLVIDSAYAEFVSRDDYSDGAELVHDSDNTVMTRTFSKIYSLAGLRIGWLYGPANVIDAMNRVRAPFNVNSIALAAATAAIADEDHVVRAREHNDGWLPRLTQSLRGMGLIVHDSVVNFLLVRFPGGADQAQAAERYLAERRIFVRNLNAYGIPDGLRINIGLDHEMAALTDALGAFMEQS
ncbi:MAG: histidinol-phosphate transaminase [Alphaproteobacteria bacterium]|jgi:histidinol-phosphate aminotransferase|nr:histidinol-phosphate transaminase [Rhodospirillaceae bacterium]MBT6206133.1 histidinol-phosphate transaminase [Rhodospirillaceae bacterium]MBT6512334.1 histidinol-phosphate transaminase [Rhodospirillaceae bacterium]MDG2481572.1 histidinol-phosphate transaminase [Alphaproteobacteria bacterium]